MQLTLDIPKATYDRLSRRASALGTTVEALAAPAVEQLAQPTAAEPAEPTAVTDGGDLPYDDWTRMFDAHMRAVEARADQYPPGHVTDVSRESMYEGCGE